MKKTAKIFLKIGHIFSIIDLVVWVLSIVILSVVAGVLFYEMTAVGDPDAGTALMVSAISCLSTAVIFMFFLPVFIALVIVSKKTLQRFVTAKCKADFKGLAIASIILGAMTQSFILIGGILALCTKEEHFNDKVIDVQ